MSTRTYLRPTWTRTGISKWRSSTSSSRPWRRTASASPTSPMKRCPPAVCPLPRARSLTPTQRAVHRPDQGGAAPAGGVRHQQIGDPHARGVHGPRRPHHAPLRGGLRPHGTTTTTPLARQSRKAPLTHTRARLCPAPFPVCGSTQRKRRIGRYELKRKLGSGANSIVRLAINMETGEKKAIKVIKRGDVSDMSRVDVELKVPHVTPHDTRHTHTHTSFAVRAMSGVLGFPHTRHM